VLTGPESDGELVWLLEPVFAALRGQVAGTATDTDRSVLARTGIRRLGGGRNNPIFGGTLAPDLRNWLRETPVDLAFRDRTIPESS